MMLLPISSVLLDDAPAIEALAGPAMPRLIVARRPRVDSDQRGEMLRRPPGEIRDAIRAFMREHGGTVRTSEVCEALKDKLGDVPSSSVRSSLQTERYFERVRRGEYRLRSH